MSGSFYLNMLQPHINERLETLHVNAQSKIMKAEGDKEFIQTSGRLNELVDLVGQIRSWANADAWPDKKG